MTPPFVITSSRKGQGKSKGKQPAPKPKPKCPAPISGSSDSEDDSVDQQAILLQLAALEKAQGFPPGGAIALHRPDAGRSTWQAG